MYPKTMPQNTIPLRSLGNSGLRVPVLGVGTNRWGLPTKGTDALMPVFSAALDGGTNLFDTAEVYTSERIIGECKLRDPRPALIVGKYAPYPTRFSTKAFLKALEASLSRLKTKTVDLYLIHFPFSFLGIASLMDMLAEAKQAGLTQSVGVSNFNANQMYEAANRLEKYCIPLAANEVHYSIFHRGPENNGVLEGCRKLNVALIAYRPIAGGRNRPNGPTLEKMVAEIAHERQKTPVQVVLNWLLQKDDHIIAIPGTTSVSHLHENIGSVSWTLHEKELLGLENASTQ